MVAGRGTRGDQRRLLRPAARRAHDRRLRGAAAGRHRAEQRAAEIGRPGGDQLAIRIDRRIVQGRAKARPAAIVSVKLISAIPSAPGTTCCDQRKIRQRERRESLRNQADRRDALRLQAEEPRRGDAAADRDQRRRRMRPQTLHADQHEQRRRGHRERQQRGLGNVLRDAEEVGEEALLGDVDSQKLRHLVQHDHEADPRLEACQHRRGNEVGDKPQTHQPRQEQHRADQRGQRGRRRDELRRVAVRHDQTELRAGQDRQRGGGADAEHPRRAEQRVDHHRDEGGVEADRNGQAGHRRVGHGLRQHDRRGRQAGDHVEAQCGGAGLACLCVCRMLIHAPCSRLLREFMRGQVPQRAADA